MKAFPFRQVHLDFHTSEAIDGIGKNFSKKQFQEMLKAGHVNSITVFSKCHHGWAYHPSSANQIHPGLKFDLLGEMIEACHEIRVNAPVYLSAGLDEKLARQRPDWLSKPKDYSAGPSDFMRPGYHVLCFNTPYLDILVKQVEEVVRKYDCDGIFLDIVMVRQCFCVSCINTLLGEGKDPRDNDAANELAERVYANYTRRINEAIRAIKPDMKIFHNGGHIPRGRRDLANMNTHLELESLPTGGWSYDHFPLSARYVQQLGMDFLGMTGKFHTSWGEFGGYKHPNALRYEVALSIANGAKCSIGDQLHPDGMMDEATYELIGKAYAEVEIKEDWCGNATNVADVAVFSVEGNGGRRNSPSDTGAARILLEGKFLFDVVDEIDDFNKYKLLILPDKITVTPGLKVKLEAYLASGGKVLASGESGLLPDGGGFALNLGAKWISENQYKPDYFRPLFPMKSLAPTAFVSYSTGQKIEPDGGTELARRENPYFNRDLAHFSSHQHTPNSKEYGGPGMTEGPDGIYIAWNVFEDYAVKGSITIKEAVTYAIDKLLNGRKTLSTDLPAQGIVTLQHQKDASRYVNHILYAIPVKRGDNINIIEDLPVLRNVQVSLKLGHAVRKVYLAPQMEEIVYSIDQNSNITFTLHELECHQMVVLEY